MNEPPSHRSRRTTTAVERHDEVALTAMWDAFWETHDREDRNTLVLAYQGVIQHVIVRLPSYVRANSDIDDLRSFGLLGLMEAIERFDPTSPIEMFRRYAQVRIRGAIYDELRRLDWLPRTIRRRVVSYRMAIDELASELGRTPNRSEVRASLGLDEKGENAMMLELQSAQLAHFNLAEIDESDDWSSGYQTINQLISGSQRGPEDVFLLAEHMQDLRAALAQLPERQRTVITLHLLAGLTQEQIGATLSISASRVSQIELVAIESLRRNLERSSRSAGAIG